MFWSIVKNILVKGVARDFEGVCTLGGKVVAPKATELRGSGSMPPQKILKFRVSEMPFPGFSAGHFQQINTQESAVVSCIVR